VDFGADRERRAARRRARPLNVALRRCDRHRSIGRVNPHDKRAVVLVDDQVDTVTILRVALELHGYACHVATSGAQALEVIQGCTPAAIIVDLAMPGMSGVEVAKKVRERLGKDVRLIALTGFADKAFRRSAREAGFDYYVLKPLSAEELIPYIEGQLHPED
jgi:CheY-like chemotaxis protein